MPRPLKVFTYTGHRNAALMPKNVHGQTREIIAATTKAEALTKSGLTRSAFERTARETTLPEEVELALASPGVVLWKPRNELADTGTWMQIPPTDN